MDAEWRLRELCPNLSDDILSALRIYHLELLRFNQTLNLVSNFTEKNADIIHFYDSVKACEFVIGETPQAKEIFDFGSGNGFPGIVMAILRPQVKVNLVDSDERKCEFLKHIVARAQLTNVKVMQMKVEDVKTSEPAIVITRAFANLARTLLLSNKILKKDSRVYSLKGPDWFSELASLPNQLCSTWNTEMAYEYELPNALGNRVLLRSVLKV